LAIFKLSKEISFPNIDLAEPDGLLAIGGDLSYERLLCSYDSGIFPWYSEGDPILWWAPNPRFIVFTKDIHISRSMNRFLKNSDFEFRINGDFHHVIHNCQNIYRKDQQGTWIDEPMKEAYLNLNKKGVSYSFETWQNGKLIGGLYGILRAKYFAGESMFSLESNASKFALIKACNYLSESGVQLLDCQFETDFLKSMGGIHIDRNEFKAYLELYS
jgi:leucyl/phenylalanyl-tRNA--protein transferase